MSTLKNQFISEGRGTGKIQGSVPLDVAKARALQFLWDQKKDPRAPDLIGAAWVAYAIWPDHQMTQQGAGGAASRILKHLAREGKAEWTSSKDSRNWGWRATRT